MRKTTTSFEAFLRTAIFVTMIGAITGLAPATVSALVPGDITIIGVHCDHPDSFAWVPMVDLPPGQVVFFTDSGWIQDKFSGPNTTSDGGIRYTAPAGGLPSGTVQTVELDGNLPPGYEDASGGLLGPRMLTGHFGDQIAAFTGSPARPFFIFALNTNSSNWGSSNPPNFAAESRLYPGLIDGFTAVAVGAGGAPGQEHDNTFFSGATHGDKIDLLFDLGDPSNWETDNDPVEDITNGTEMGDDYEVTPGPEPEFKRGDTTINGVVDFVDAITHLEFVFLGRGGISCEDAGDVNDNGIADFSDDIVLLEVLFLGRGVIPAPGILACGSDRTQDAIECAFYPSCN